MPAPQTFRTQFAQYKARIDADVSAYTGHARAAIRSQYGEEAALVSGAYLDLVVRRAPRVGGTLTMVGYEMLGGTDQTMIARAATAIEMLHAHLEIVDDIETQATLRDGQPTVPAVLTASRLAGGNQQLGTSLALNAALSGSHAAQMLLAGLSADPELIRKVLGIVSHTLAVTSHGQTYSLLQELPGAQRDDTALARVRHWKSAEHTFLNPLCVGMVLAGAGCEDTNAIRGYALQSGAAFNIVQESVKRSSHHAHAEAARDTHITQACEALRTIRRPWNSEHVHFLSSLTESLRAPLA